jgi:GxxExxY protein
VKWDDSTYRQTTDKVIKAFYRVRDALGPGFLEEAYQTALYVELNKTFTNVSREKAYPVTYGETEVSKYVPDIVVDERVIVEVKAVKALNQNHKAQIISQLRVTDILIGFLVNFANKDLEFKRFDNFYEIEKRGLKLD